MMYGVVLLLGVPAADLPRAAEKAEVALPDFGAELRRFEAPQTAPVPWWPHVVNAGWGGGRGGPERNGGWLDENWMLVDYLDRSSDYTTHGWLTHRGIWYEVYGSNEYQETIHFQEQGARKYFWDNGIARDALGRRVLSEHYNVSIPWWAEKVGWDAFITCNNAPRWWAVIDYDWLTSPLLGHAMSQDNIGGPTSRIGAGGHGRYCDHCNARFFHYLEQTGRLADFRRRYRNIRDYVAENLADVLGQLPPAAKHRYDEAEAERYARLCAPPVMSEYQKFLYLSHLHNFLRYYEDAKLVAARQGRAYDVHGNQGGGFIGPNPYQVALADFVDTIWFESAGESAYDIFRHRWHNAWGPFRYQMCYAMSRGRKPVMCMSRFEKRTPDLVEHEMAEQCAGGGVLFVGQDQFAEEPALQRMLADYFRFRHAHRALFADPGRTRYADVAMLYSIPTLMYRNYQYSGGAEPVCALSGMARALEEAHVPYDVVIFNHPEIHADRASLAELKRYKLLILPAVECLSDGQVEMLAAYVAGGGTLGTIGPCGVRNEDNLPRAASAIARWRAAGRVVDLMPGRKFLGPRAPEGPRTREIAEAAIAGLRQALGAAPLVTGSLPRMLWLKSWRHGDDCVSLHLVNYDVDYEAGTARPTAPVKISVRWPSGMPAEEAAWLTPDGKSTPVALAVQGGRAQVTIPSVRVYGVLVLGRAGLDAQASAALQAQAMAARASLASGHEETGPVHLAQRQQQADREYLDRVRQAIEMPGAAIRLDFGAKSPAAPWQAVGAESAYAPERGFGWLPKHDASLPTPEELHYGQAASAVQRGDTSPTDVREGRLLFWPYPERAPAPLATNLFSGTPRRFRIDVAPGSYRVRAVVTNPSWIFRNYLVSGMVAANGAVQLLDTPLDRGALVAREFSVAAPAGTLELTLGGPTGWAIAAILVAPGPGDEDPQAAGGLREWRVSPRYANPDWHPIRQVAAPPEKRLDAAPPAEWNTFRAAGTGLAVVDLGSNAEAEIGDVVYAATTVRREEAGRAVLHFSATSAAQLWLNGQALGYVPNEKGLRRDEFTLPVELRKGENRLVVKLERFWERRWLFSASLTER